MVAVASYITLSVKGIYGGIPDGIKLFKIQLDIVPFHHHHQ